MKNLFVSYEIAKQLKEKGFDEPCICVYKKEVKKTVYPVLSNEPSYPFKTVKNTGTGSLHFTAPLYQQVADWFREEKKIFILVSPFPVYSGKYGISYGRGQLHGGYQPVFENGDTYYGAYNEVITEALKLI